MVSKKQNAKAKRSPPKRGGSARSSLKTSWEPVAQWYDGWMGKEGSEHHRRLALPAVMELLQPQTGEQILDLGCGQGVLAPLIEQAQAHYTGVDASPTMLKLARKRHGSAGSFIRGDSRKLSQLPGFDKARFDGVVFLLSLQDMSPLEQVIAAASGVLKVGGRLVIVLTHPCFRVPRQSGWGWDEDRKLRYRRIDRYLTSLAVPLKAYHKEGQGEGGGTTYNFHHPLEKYINTLVASGLVVNALREIPGYKLGQAGPDRRADELATQEIPLFLGLRGCKL